MVNVMTNDNRADGMLTITEVSRLLHVHPNTLRRWSEEGLIRAYRIGPRGDRRFKSEDIAKLLLGKAEDGGDGADPAPFNSASKVDVK
jgi:excisionase family DNA binding protein